MHRKDINFQLSWKQIPTIYVHFQQKIIKNLLKLWKSSNSILKKVLKMANSTIEITLFIILLLQTAHILNHRNSNYVNVRHLLVKWIFFICILFISTYIKEHTQLDQLFRFMCNLMAFIIVYPSKVNVQLKQFIKELHLKSYKYKQKNQNGQIVLNLIEERGSIFGKIMSSFAWILLKIIKFVIIFVPLTKRKYIEEQVKEINTIILEERSFWKIYESQKNSSAQYVKPQNNYQQSKFENTSIEKISFSNIQSKQSLNYQKKSMMLHKLQSKAQLKKSIIVSQTQMGKKVGIIKAKAQEHIQMNLPTILNKGGFKKKYVFYRKINIQYNLDNCVLTISCIQDGKTENYTLEEILIINDEIIQFQCQNQQDLISVKFQTQEQQLIFINSVNSS